MTGHRFKQGINGLSLNPVGWVPRMPACRLVFRQSKLWFVIQKTQKVAYLFFETLTARCRVLDPVEQIKLEVWIDLDCTGSNAGFFLSFSECSFQERFPFVAVTFWEIPAAWVTHEQKFT